MIQPKTPKPSKADEKRAYADATERDQSRCVRCGYVGPENQRDHRQNRQAGNTVVSNLQLLCGPHFKDGHPTAGCHTWKGERPALALLEGFAVPRWAHWSFWPAWRADVHSWVIYFDTPDSRGRWWDEITESTAHMLMNGGTA